MSSFAIVNLRELEDSVGGRVEGIEGRFGRTSLESEHLGVSLFRYAPNRKAGGGHHHREQEEAYIVIAGSGRVFLDGEVHEVSQWDVVRVSPSVVRAFNAGPDGLEVIAIGSDRPEGGDGMQDEIEWEDD
jgi:quercetin dioxygenase-like cupin family protein